MKPTIVSILIIASVIGLSSCTSKHGDENTKIVQNTTASAEEYYTCPMHPFVRRDRPGPCPVCGMALVKKSSLKELPGEELRSLQEVTLSPTQRVLANIATAKVESREFSRQIRVVGIVSVAEPTLASITARFRGRVEKLYINYTGELVHKGQPLFDLYSPDLISATQDFLLALEAVKSARARFDTQGAVSQENLLRASRTRLNTHFGMSDEQIRETELSLKVPRSVRFDSPLPGTVLAKRVQEGQFVDEGTELYQVADLSKVWMYFDVYERDVRFVTSGAEVVATTSAYPGEKFHGRVTFVEPVVNQDSRTIRIRTEFSNPKSNLKPNMYVDGTINTPTQRLIAVPATAVINTGRRTVVWVEVKENAFEPRDVTLGSTFDSYFEVVDGLREGETIAVSGGYLIDSESQLQQPNTTNQHAGHTQTDKSDSKQEASHDSPVHSDHSMLGLSSSVVNIKVLVKGGYTPDEVHIKLGQTVRLHFYRDEDSGCSREVVFEKFNIQRTLRAYETTVIEITPTQADTVQFTCGMRMLRGTLIVEP